MLSSFDEIAANYHEPMKKMHKYYEYEINAKEDYSKVQNTYSVSTVLLYLILCRNGNNNNSKRDEWCFPHEPLNAHRMGKTIIHHSLNQ